MISQKYLDRYKEIYRKKHGKDLSDQEALEQATKLITLVKVIYRPLQKSKETVRGVDRAYDILFDEIQRQQNHACEDQASHR
ncbi:hypothetical protein C4568_00210 [Candidatus Parcubacteria bacterium]|nr:MAG: hypothetical protein C4568_00210 [Candidatus Parcubacteria bacterium]